jgi:hypothetical protein
MIVIYVRTEFGYVRREFGWIDSLAGLRKCGWIRREWLG